MSPQISHLFSQLALHYQTVLLPARSYKPKDKAKVENAVKNVYTQVFAPLRNMQFFNLEDINDAITRQLDEYNRRRFPSRQYSRLELFEKVEKQALRPFRNSVSRSVSRSAMQIRTTLLTFTAIFYRSGLASIQVSIKTVNPIQACTTITLKTVNCNLQPHNVTCNLSQP